MRGGTIDLGRQRERGGSIDIVRYISTLLYTKVLWDGLELDSVRHGTHATPRVPESQRHGVRVHCVALKDRLDKMLRRLRETRVGPITSFALTDSLSVVPSPSPHYARFCWVD